MFRLTLFTIELSALDNTVKSHYMAYVKITSITKGAKGTSRYFPEQIDSKFAYDVGLEKYSMWLSDLKVGDHCIVPYKEIENIREKGKGVFEIELIHPKYANHQVGSDVYPFEIIEWITETKVKVRQMMTLGCAGEGGCGCEEYASNPEAPVLIVREHKNGGLYRPGTRECPFILSEEPYYFRDPSF